MMDRILLLDGLNFIYRGLIKFKWGEGKQEDQFVIVYNFFRNLRATIEQFNPTKVFFCLEGENNFRYKLYPAYKGNRIIKTGEIENSKKEKSALDFSRQRNIIINLLPNLPITIVSAETFEADDIIATLAANLKDEEITIYSGDSDFIQLLQKGYKSLKLYNSRTKEYIAVPGFHYLTYKSITGDKSDNIPSLVGPKKAEKIVCDIKKFTNFLDIEENKANYILNKELIELKIIPDEDLKFVNYNINYTSLKEEFFKMDFKTMLEEKYWERFCNTFNNLR